MVILPHRRKAFRGGGAPPPPSFLINFDFEETGNPVAPFPYTFGTYQGDPDYTTIVLDGAQSMALNSAYLYIIGFDEPEVWIKFRWRIEGTVHPVIIMNWSTATFNGLGTVQYQGTSGKVTLDYVIESGAAIVPGTTYFMWLHVKAGATATTNGVFEFWFSTVDSRPPRGGANHLTTGVFYNENAYQVGMQQYPTPGPTVVIDDLQIARTEFF